MEFKIYLNTLRQKGYLAYEYNPFFNYQTDVNLYLVDNKYLVPEGQAVNSKNGELLVYKDEKWIDKRGNIINNKYVLKPSDGSKPYYPAGSLMDLDTEKLNFDLNHPVEIEVLPSYDGSVNLIINDDKNIPRIINSRFSVREKNTYEIVDRIGENDTNIYNSNTFDKDTSLYFLYEYNPIIDYKGLVNGVLPVGLYCFYLTYCDSDNNESDYIAESGLIPVFIGNDSDPFSMDGGIKNQNSNKGIRLRLSNLDKSYNYLKIYYVRYFADYLQNRALECKKIHQRYPINSGNMFIQITGNEQCEDLDPNILNITRFNPKCILAQAQCKNMLFFGNIVKNTDDYRDLLDCALRIIPELEISETINTVQSDYYLTENNQYGYYDSSNMYNKVGYFNNEYYRFGVVFIYLNGTLSNVYNTLGGTLENNLKKCKCNTELYKEENHIYLKRNYIPIDDFGWVDKSKYDNSLDYLNSKGVCKINKLIKNDNEIIGIKFNIDNEVIKHLKEDLGIRGLFFVRLKCIPNILAQCYLIPMDEQLEAPIIEETNDYITECFLTLRNDVDLSNYNIINRMRILSEMKEKELKVTNNYLDRLYKYRKTTNNLSISTKAYAAICPDFLLNQPYYNQIFNGSEFNLLKLTKKSKLTTDSNRERIYNSSNTYYESSQPLTKATICTVTEDVNTVAIKDKIFRLELGECEESFRFGWAEVDNGVSNSTSDSEKERVNRSSNLVRGKYSPYLAIYSNSILDTSCLYNIYKGGNIDIKQEYQNRMDSSEPFYAISDRYNFEGLVFEDRNNKSLTCYRGDCYINQFTYRLNRNFNDPSLPNNDKIIDPNTWKNNYDAFDPTKWTKISRSDINAVQLGSWITIKLRSAVNYALRSVDHSYVSEEALMGAPRSFYPRSQLLHRGENKMPDSYLYNDAYRASLGYKCYFTLQDINYIKNTFSNRIQYSAISILDSYKNNYRYSLSTYFRDYSQEYGSILKLIEINGNLLVVFEHGIGLAAINERILAGEGQGGQVFINSQNVLPEELFIISDTYGTQWGDSVIKSEAGFVYGIDTVAKKIWRVKGQQLEILSDFKVNKFLIDNITLGERELYPTIGLRNVKTHYNNNKKDVIFTFYDDVYKDEEKAWSLCYNELLGDSGTGCFVTFYSWIPSFSENIDTQFFTFDRNTSKRLSLLSKSNYAIPENSGVLLDTPVFKKNNNNEYDTIIIRYKDIQEEIRNSRVISNSDGTTYLKKNLTNKTDEEYSSSSHKYKFTPEHDHWGNWKLFTIVKLYDDEELLTYHYKLQITNIDEFEKAIKAQNGIILLEITPSLDDNNSNTIYYPTETVALTTDDYLKGINFDYNKSKENKNLTTDFYLHGQAGIFNIKESLSPTYWYGEVHPFELEFVVNDNVGYLKLFNNLVIISNKAEPESFHFEIEGDNYDFSTDKRAMYFRQESTKELFLNLGSDMLYDRNYKDIIADRYTQELYYRGNPIRRDGKSITPNSEYEDQYNKKLDKVYPVYSEGLVLQKKSTIFPLYYERIDTYNEIYHKYREMLDGVETNYDFKNLSGSEIKWYKDLNQFNIVTHIKNNPIDLVGRLRGNSYYKEGKWNIQIPSITFSLKNEENWPLNSDKTYHVPPIVINSSYVPKDLTDNRISVDKLPNTYTRLDRENGDNPEKESLVITNYIDTKDWTYRKETNIRDKWMKVRIRYSGKNLAIIHSIATLYNLSYS